MEKYIVAADIKVLDNSLSRYVSMINNNYDAKFEVYENQIRQLIPQQLKASINEGAPGSSYFTCEKAVTKACCKSTTNSFNCQRCDCWLGVKCDEPLTVWQVAPCPFIQDPNNQGRILTWRYSLVNPQAWYDYILQEFGIEQAWVTFETYSELHPVPYFSIASSNEKRYFI